MRYTIVVTVQGSYVSTMVPILYSIGLLVSLVPLGGVWSVYYFHLIDTKQLVKLRLHV